MRPQLLRCQPIQSMQTQRTHLPMIQAAQRRNYYGWLFGYDGIDDSLKRTPRSLYVILLFL